MISTRSATTRDPSFRNQPHGERVEPMLGLENSLRQPRLIVVGMNRHDRLSDDRPAVEFRADEMNRAAGKADAGCERLPLRMQAAEGGEQ